MYLSELFLETLGLDFSTENVKTALQRCQEYYDEKMQNSGRRSGSSISAAELRDFWDVAAEFEEAAESCEVWKLAQNAADRK